jgi:hypothetical protein
MKTKSLITILIFVTTIMLFMPVKIQAQFEQKLTLQFSGGASSIIDGYEGSMPGQSDNIFEPAS